MTYREYIKQNMTGKKFKTAQEMRTYMKQLASEWKKKKTGGKLSSTPWALANLGNADMKVYEM